MSSLEIYIKVLGKEKFGKGLEDYQTLAAEFPLASVMKMLHLQALHKRLSRDIEEGKDTVADVEGLSRSPYMDVCYLLGHQYKTRAAAKAALELEFLNKGWQRVNPVN